MAYEDFKDLSRRPIADEALRDKAFNIAKNKYDGCQRRFASMVYKWFDKRTSDNGFKNENISNKELAKELISQSFDNLIKEKYTHLLRIIFGVQVIGYVIYKWI